MTLRRLITVLVAAASLVVLAPLAGGAESFVFFGTFTQAGSEGIYRARFDPTTGNLNKAELAVRTQNPVFIRFHPKGTMLYAIGERSTGDGPASGTLEAFSVDRASGQLSSLGYAAAGGGPLCYVEVDRTGRSVLSASYRSGYVVSFPLRQDLTPASPASFIPHSGSSVHPRQKAPHAHCIDLDPANRFALVADLGLDRVYAYRFDKRSGELVQMPDPFATQPGAGPRHLAFDHSGKHVYLINELDNTLSVADYDADTGQMKQKQLLSLLPAEFKGQSDASEVVIHPSGRFLYASNRGFDSLAVYAISAETGMLNFVQHMRDGVRHPRHFAIYPDGKWLLCGNRDANTVTVYPIDTETGRLGPIASTIDVPMVSCVQFLPR